MDIAGGQEHAPGPSRILHQGNRCKGGSEYQGLVNLKSHPVQSRGDCLPAFPGRIRDKTEPVSILTDRIDHPACPVYRDFADIQDTIKID